MAVKYLAGERLIGTAAERAALTTGQPTVQDDMTDQSLWTLGTSCSFVTEESKPALKVTTGASPPNLASRAITLTDNYDEMVIDIDWKMDSANPDMTFVGVVSLMASGIDPFNNLTITNNNKTFTLGSNGSSGGHRYYLWRGKEASGSTDHNQSFDGGVNATTLYYYRIVIDVPTITIYQFASDANRTDYNYGGSSGTIVTTTTITLPTSNCHSSSTTDAAIHSASNKFSHFWTGCFSTGADNTYLYGFKIYENSTVPIAISYPDLPNGATFLTSDTNVLYMWNGTDTWNGVG